MFEEVLWQMNGFYAKSIKQRKIMIKLLESAEAYAKSSGYKTISISRNPKLHNFTREKIQESIIIIRETITTL